MSETHELRLKIDASAAKRGSREFIAAMEAAKRAVQDLDRDTNGVFTKLKKAPASRKAQTAGLTSINSAARQAEAQVATLQRQLNKVGNAAGIQRTDAALESFRQELTASVATTEDLRLAKDRLAQTMHEVREGARAAAEVQRLRTQYQRTAAALDPVTTGTHAYRRALIATEQAARAGAISEAQKTKTLAQARDAYLSAEAAAENYAAQQSRQFGTRAGWGMARGSGRQLSLQLSQMAQVAGMATSTEQALKSMSYQAADIGLIFGAMGTAIGAVAGIALPLLIDAVGGAIRGGETFEDQLKRLQNLSQGFGSTIEILEMNLGELSEKYGAAAIRVRELTIAQAELRAGEVRDALRQQVAELGFITRRYQQAKGAAMLYSRGVANIAQDFDITRKQAAAFHDTLLRLGAATTFDDQRRALRDVVKYAREAGIPLESFPPEIRKAAIQMVELSNETDALEQLIRNAADAAGAATGQTNAWAGAMAGVRAEINAIAASLSNIGGGVIDNVAKEAELKALNAGKSVREAAVAAERMRKEAEFDARSQGANWFERQMIEMERFQWERGLSLDSQIDAAREAARERASSSGGGGGGRVERLGDESRQLERLSKNMNNRIFDLNRENEALRILATGQTQTLEGAQMLADAQRLGGGAIDQQTRAMVRQYEMAVKLNEALTKAANDPVREWQKAVPTITEATQQIEREGLESLSSEISSVLKGGEFSFDRFANSIVSTWADAMGKIAANWIWQNLFGSMFGGGLGGSTSALSIGAGMWREGGLSTAPVMSAPVPMTAFANAPHYAEGTANTSGIPAMLHENEAVVPLSRGRKIPVEMGGAGGLQIGDINAVANVTVEGDATEEDAEKIAETVAANMRAMIQREISDQMAYGGALNPRGIAR